MAARNGNPINGGPANRFVLIERECEGSKRHKSWFKTTYLHNVFTYRN